MKTRIFLKENNLQNVNELKRFVQLVKEGLKVMALDIDKESVNALGDKGFELVIRGKPFNVKAKIWKKKDNSGWRLQLPKEKYVNGDGEEKELAMVFLENGSASLYQDLLVAIHKYLKDNGFMQEQKDDIPF